MAIRLSDVVVVKDAALLSWQIGGGPEQSHGLMGLLRRYDRWWDALDMYANGDCWDEAFTAYPLAGGVWQSDALEPTEASLSKYGLPGDLVAAAGMHNSDVRADLDQHRMVPGKLVRPRCSTEYYGFNPTQQILTQGGTLNSSRNDTSGYGIVLHYTANDARGAVFQQPYARAPTQAEIIPNPAGYHFTSNAVMYFDLTIDGPKPVTFAPGTAIDIWFPFVLDDSLRYDLTIGFADRPIGPIYSKPFDNVLHYTLPEFTVTPGRTLMAEIDGNWP